MIKKLSVIAVLSLLAVFTVSCGSSGITDNPDSDMSGAPLDTVEVKINDVSVDILSPDTAYTIIRPEKADEAVLSAASNLWKTLHEKSSSNSITIKEDWVKDGGVVVSSDKEILIGSTNRAESAEALNALPKYLDYSITVTDNKIVICANTPERVAEAVGFFISSLDYPSDGKVIYNGKNMYIDEYNYPLSDALLGGRSIDNIKIVTAADAPEAVLNLADKLSLFFAENTGKAAEVISDNILSDGPEIVIGSTSRGKLPEDMTSSEYRIALAGSTISIFASNSGGYVSAFGTFREKFSTSDGYSHEFSESFVGNSLDGKKAVFIGNSFIYYGGCVETGSQRNPDKGMFYQVCKSNGDEVTVYDCTYGGHSLSDFTTSGCHYDSCKGTSCYGSDLLRGIDLNSIDFVFISEAGQNNSSIMKDIKAITDRFPNPDTKFFYLNHSYTYFKNHSNIQNNLVTMKKQGIAIVNWGEVAYDLAQGKTRPNGSKLSYTKNTFIKNNGDTYHPNPLAGYITAQMAYCAASGKSAVGQDYSFCNKIKFGSSVTGFDAYIAKHYKSASDTNFKKVFESENDMLELQKMMDEYLAAANQ